MTTTEILSNATVPSGDLVKAKTICLALKIGRFGNTRQASLAGAVLSQDDPTQEPDKRLLRLSKTLIDSPELIAIAKHDSALTARIRQLAFKSLFKGGVYLIPVAMVESINTILQDAIKVRETLVDVAVSAYPTRVQETSERLGIAANALDYPSDLKFRAAFYIEYSYVTFDTPDRLKAISAEIFKAEVEKQRARLASVAVECQQAMRAGLLTLVDHLAERLTPDAEGKSKRLANTTITHLQEWLTLFELKNVTDDDVLGDVVAKARAVMTGIDHKTLKSDDLVRQKMVEGLTAVKTALDPLVLDKNTRLITFSEDE